MSTSRENEVAWAALRATAWKMAAPLLLSTFLYVLANVYGLMFVAWFSGFNIGLMVTTTSCTEYLRIVRGIEED